MGADSPATIPLRRAAVFLPRRLCSRGNGQGSQHGGADLFQLHCALDCGFRRHYSHVDPVALPDNPGDGDGLMYVAILIARLTGVYPVVEAKA